MHVRQEEKSRKGVPPAALNLSPSAWGHGTINANGKPYYQNGAVTGAPGLQLGVITVVNDVGGFFNAAPNGVTRLWGIPLYPGNTKRAQATILLHEMGHSLQLPNFQDDGTDDGLRKANDSLVNANCKLFIEALP